MPQVSYAGLFPFCITPTDDESLVGDGTWYPLGFTKEEVCALYWKNKSYNVSHSENTSLTYGGGVYTFDFPYAYSGVVTYAPSGENVFKPTIETDFICADVVSKSIYFAYDEAGYTPVAIILFGYEIFLPFFSDPSLLTNCYYYNGLFYPFMVFVSPFGYISVKDWAVKNVNSVFYPYYGWTQAQVDLISVTATCTFLGKNVPVYWTGSYTQFLTDPTADPPTYPITSGTVSGSMVVTLNEQWPYNP